MTSTEISLSIIESCKAYQPLNDWVDATFNKELTYSRGLRLDIDYFSYDEYATMPLIIIDPERKQDNRSPERVWEMLVHTKIVHTADEFKDGGFPVVDNVVTIAGLDESEKMCDLIVEAIKLSDAEAILEDIEIIIDPVEFVSNATEYDGHIVLTYTKENTIGCSI